MVGGWQVLLTSSLNAGVECFFFPKGSSLVFGEDTGELHSPLATHTSEDTGPELTVDGLPPFPLAVSKTLPRSRPQFPHFMRVLSWGGGAGSLSITDCATPLQ